MQTHGVSTSPSPSPLPSPQGRRRNFVAFSGRADIADLIQRKEFADEAKALKEHDKLIAEKLKKGYKETTARAVASPLAASLEAALVENIQRADLNPIEKAQGFKDYLTRFHMTQEQLADLANMHLIDDESGKVL